MEYCGTGIRVEAAKAHSAGSWHAGRHAKRVAQGPQPGATLPHPCRDAPPKQATKAKTGTRRKRTKITAELRDKVKAALGKEASKNTASKRFGISYIVVKKIEDGAYDKL